MFTKCINDLNKADNKLIISESFDSKESFVIYRICKNV